MRTENRFENLEYSNEAEKKLVFMKILMPGKPTAQSINFHTY